MANETKLSPEEQAAQDAHTATRAEEQSWGSKIEERLAALEDKVGLSKSKGGADATDGAAALADEHGIDLSKVEGTGSGGRITKDDVQAYIDKEKE